ncbi:hypothetical protein BBJ28_00017865 [Nothophytophthora sp. Chile5]|nr:hypothetical protein BBJ28_00017865 [Nothophytophthora sp. Chile5]
MKSIVIYSDSECIGTPVRVYMTESSNCSTVACSEGEYNGGVQYRTTSCVDSDRQEYIAEVFNGISYVTLDYFETDGCQEPLQFSSSYLAAGTCQSGTTNATVITKLYSNGSALIQAFKGLSCGKASSHFALDSDTIANHTCVQDRYKFYSSMDGATSSSGSSSSAAGSSAESSSISQVSATSGTSISTAGIIGIIAGCLVLVLGIAAFIFARRRSKKHSHPSELATPTDLSPDSKPNHVSLKSATAHGSEGRAHSSTEPDTQERFSVMAGTATGMWNDDAIIAARLPREKVLVQDLISRGGYGEVYTATFNEQLVAVKMLLPETRKSIRHVNDFLAEVKMMATMDHPRIVRFIGVAWDSLADLCVVVEYMAGGDLRALLNRFQEEKYPTGFDQDKVKIALHIAHALTYMHSLEPAVIHRDLKSKNILLTPELDAKLTDFGISRERVDKTMTAGVGTSLWMAPEVMMGEKYDDKADMFSFGVVLSELDSHSLPYSHAKDQSNSGRKMPDAVILQQVTMGNLRVEFSQSGLQSMVALGLACVAVDPKDRPTSAEALGKLHTILTHEV